MQLELTAPGKGLRTPPASSTLESAVMHMGCPVLSTPAHISPDRPSTLSCRAAAQAARQAGRRTTCRHMRSRCSCQRRPTRPLRTVRRSTYLPAPLHMQEAPLTHALWPSANLSRGHPHSQTSIGTFAAPVCLFLVICLCMHMSRKHVHIITSYYRSIHVKTGVVACQNACMTAWRGRSTNVDGARAAAVAGQRPDVGCTVGGDSRAVIPCNPP